MCLGMTGVITAVRHEGGVPMAVVDTGVDGTVPACLLACLEADVGDTVLVHCGYVLRIIDGPTSAGVR
jgi:hydrogenase maturation factor